MSDVGEMQHRLYTLLVRSGKPFSITVPGNPSTSHDGGTSVASLVLTPEEAALLADVIAGHGCTVEIRESARQTPEQKHERETLLGIGKEDAVWPSAACPACAWFDPLLETVPCGRAAWGTETITVFMESPKPQQDAEACPVPHLWHR